MQPRAIRTTPHHTDKTTHEETIIVGVLDAQLLQASRGGQREEAARLLREGASARARDAQYRDQTSLRLASQLAHASMVSPLLKKEPTSRPEISRLPH